MNFLENSGYEGALSIFRGFRLPIKDRLASAQESQHGMIPPSTVSTDRTLHSLRTQTTSHSSNTAYSYNSGGLLQPSNYIQKPQPIRSLPVQYPLGNQSRIFPSATSTTSIIPGPSIAESIVNNPTSVTGQAILGPQEYKAPLINQHGINSTPRNIFMLSQLPGTSQSSLLSKQDHLRRSLFTLGQESTSLGSNDKVDHLRQMPPPKRKLPFPEVPKPQNSKPKIEKNQTVDKCKSTQDGKHTKSRNYNLRKRGREVPSETNLRSSQASEEETAVRQSSKDRKENPKRERVDALKVRKRPASPVDAKSTRPAKKTALGMIVAKEQTRRKGQQPSKQNSVAAKSSRMDLELPRSGAGASKDLAVKKPASKPAAKTSVTKNLMAKAFIAKPSAGKTITLETTTPAFTSTATQTEEHQSPGRPKHTSQGTQAHLLTTKLKNSTTSKATQTGSPSRPPILTPRSRPVLGNLSPNVSQLGSSPSERRAKRAPPPPPPVLANKFSKPPGRVNKFNRNPDMALKGVE